MKGNLITAIIFPNAIWKLILGGFVEMFQYPVVNASQFAIVWKAWQSQSYTSQAQGGYDINKSSGTIGVLDLDR